MAEVQIPKSSLEGNNSFTPKNLPKGPGEVEKPESTARIAPPKKESFREKFRKSFVGNDIQSVGEYLIFSVAIPALKNTILNLINNGASMLLNGAPQQSSLYSQRSNGQYVSYNYISRNNNGPYAGATYSNNPIASGVRNISWANEREAMGVLADMCDYIFNNNQVSVAKYYTLARIPGLRPNYQDEYWGWYSLETATVAPSAAEPGRWIIDLPRPVYLR